MSSLNDHPVKPDCLYRQNQIREFLGVNAATFAKWKREGLRVLNFGRRNFIYGAHLIEFLLMVNQGDRSRSVETSSLGAAA